MKIIRGIDQRSWEWFCLRAGKVTASGVKNLITDKGQIRKWSTDMPNSYLHLKLAEKWRGCPQEVFGGNRQTDQGVFGEPQALSVYTALTDNPIEKITGIESDDGRCWASPDGWTVPFGRLLQEGIGIEIKFPNPSTHIGYLLTGGVPEEYVLQVQFSLWVAGSQEWHFFSYCRDLPELIVAVSRDVDLALTIAEAVKEFNYRFDDCWTHLCDLNGGPPPKRTPPKPPIGFGVQPTQENENEQAH